MITHPEKVLFPDDGITKGELASYYEMIAPAMLPHIRNRPITMERYHRGIGAPGFFQKDVKKGFPPWLERVEVPKRGGTVHHPIVTDTRSLLWLANQNCITPHVWTSRAPDLYHPDVCVFDLDPSLDEPDVLRAAALLLRDLLDELDLTSWIKTTGSKGFHIVVPLDGVAEMGEVERFAHAVGRTLVARDPEHLTQEFSKADRGGRILVDTGRNGYSATFAAAYAVRPLSGAPVSAPCTWEEVETGEVGPRTFTLRAMADRLARVGDAWSGLLACRQSLQAAAERLLLLPFALLLGGCDAGPDVAPGALHPANGMQADADVALLACDVDDAGPRALPPTLRETSGLARGARDTTLLWTHNDSGGEPELYALEDRGRFIGQLRVFGPVRVAGARLVDWEDIEAGVCDGEPCLYIADIGDNSAGRSHITVYRVREPASEDAAVFAEALHARYPDGPHNAEALFALPSGDLYIITKGDQRDVVLYRWPAPSTADTAMLERVRTLFPRQERRRDRVTAASATPDGRRVGVRTYRTLYLYAADELVAPDTGSPLRPHVFDLTPLNEQVGEGLALADDGMVWLSSEGSWGRSPQVRRLRCSLPE